jgi:hypothetical protein
MTDHPAHIVAEAKALAEKHGFILSQPRIDMLCEALTTTPPSEEAMTAYHSTPNADHGPKPTPTVTEDHLRRACEECERDRDATGQMQYVRTVARLLAERDAMQARVEERSDAWATRKFKVGGCQNDEPTVIEMIEHYYRSHDMTMWAALAREAVRKASSPQPTPDPDLVLAREAAAQDAKAKGSHDLTAQIRAGEADDTIGVRSALRALKLKGERPGMAQGPHTLEVEWGLESAFRSRFEGERHD